MRPSQVAAAHSHLSVVHRTVPQAAKVVLSRGPAPCAPIYCNCRNTQHDDAHCHKPLRVGPLCGLSGPSLPLTALGFLPAAYVPVRPNLCPAAKKGQRNVSFEPRTVVGAGWCRTPRLLGGRYFYVRCSVRRIPGHSTLGGGSRRCLVVSGAWRGRSRVDFKPLPSGHLDIETLTS